MAFTWYDAYGRRVDTSALKLEQAAPTVAGVRRHDAHHPAAGLTPQRLARILREAVDGDPEDYLALAEDMEERDLHYSGVLAVRKRQVAGLEIVVEAAGDDAESVRDAELVREVVGRDGFQTELFDILDAIGKGFSCTEIIWETSASQWRPARLAWRDPRWFTFDPVDGETPLLRDIGGNVALAPAKWIVHSAKVKSGLPIRGGIARAAAWAFLFKAFTVKDWAIFCEAYGQPLRLGKYDAGATEADKDVLLQAVSNIGTDYAAIVPQSMAIEIIRAEVNGSHEIYEKRGDWLDRQVSKVVLGQTATTDAIAGGHAVGKTHDKVREDIEQSDAIQLAATLNRDLVIPLVSVNHGPRKKYPKIRIGRPEEVDVEKLVQNVAKLVPLGLKVGAKAMREKIGVPEPAADDELLVAPRHAPAEQPEDDPEQPPQRQEALSTRKGLPTGDRDAIDRSIDDMMEDWQPLVVPIIDGLETQIAAATSLDEVRAILTSRLEGMDVSALTEILAQLAFAARLAGETGEKL
ncbi:MAG: DUF935 domain-containing protein [Rhizobiaceae bacterium]|nr:DUF935 domain-containing protein [Rhizobiaceae bacterium]